MRDASSAAPDTGLDAVASPEWGKLRRRAPTLLTLCLIGTLAAACTAADQGPSSTTAGQGDAREDRPPRSAAAQRPVRPSAEVVLDGVALPAALTFAPDGRLFFVEVNAGRIRVARGRELQPRPFATLPVQQASESGLLGLALDPDFADNHFVYAYYSEGAPSSPSLGLRNRVVRFTDRDGEGVEMTPILDDLPVNSVGGQDAHQGGALAFGPDGMLYVAIGDTGSSGLAQDPASLAGKILRVGRDGSIPSDNPFPGSPVFALGFRNPWGMAFHPRTGELFATENGNKAHDEINLVQSGGNYGWAVHEGTQREPGFADPVWDSGDGRDARHGMVGLGFYVGGLFPELGDELLFCAFKSGTLRRVALEPPSYDRVRAVSRLGQDCRLGVTVGLDGALYVSSISQVIRLAP